MIQTLTNRPARQSDSRFKGVQRHIGKKPWRAALYVSSCKPIQLGTFNTEEEAARAYDDAASHLVGPNAFLNFRDLAVKTQPIIEGPLTRVPLLSDSHFVIDTIDLPLVGKYYWTVHCGTMRGTFHREKIQLHILLLGQLPPSHAVVHLNGDRLDCRKANLAVVPRSLQLGRARKTRRCCSSIYKGVSKGISNLWRAKIGGQEIGSFSAETAAALAYDEAARRRYGIFAALNFPNDSEISCLSDSVLPLAA